MLTSSTNSFGFDYLRAEGAVAMTEMVNRAQGADADGRDIVVEIKVTVIE